MSNKGNELDNILIEKGNFWFVEKFDKELYNILAELEGKCRLNLTESLSSCRLGLEAFVKAVIRDNNIRNIDKYILQFEKNKYKVDLVDKLKYLRNDKFLKENKFIKDNMRAEDKFLPKPDTVTYLCDNGKVASDDCYSFIRWLGNAISHLEVSNKSPQKSSVNAEKAVKAFFILCKRYYMKRLNREIGNFNENFMPIGEYKISKWCIPNDSNMAKCKKEFWGYKINTQNNKTQYSILRLYEKNQLEEKFLMRGTDALNEAAKESYSSIPEGMIKTVDLIDYKSTKSDYFVRVYEFNQEPYPLNEETIRNLDMGSRIRICKRIVDCLYNLQDSDIPIYHRMLNYESVYLCRIKNVFEPYITKFDYAKIDYNDNNRTVVNNVIDAKRVMKELSLIKYLAPEWINAKSEKDLIWEKIDLYSLGVLIVDIICGTFNITSIAKCIENLKGKEISDEMVELIDSLLSDDPSERISLGEVKTILDEEWYIWK